MPRPGTRQKAKLGSDASIHLHGWITTGPFSKKQFACSMGTIHCSRNLTMRMFEGCFRGLLQSWPFNQPLPKVLPTEIKVNYLVQSLYLALILRGTLKWLVDCQGGMGIPPGQ